MARPTGVYLSTKSSLLGCPTCPNPTVENTSEIGAAPNLPMGGTTGLCHQSTEAIGQAAAWYREHRETAERPLIPALRRRFGLTSHEAVMALREANA